MPQPTRSDIHVNAPLTNLSVAFSQDMSQFVAGRVFPSVPVANQGNKYFKYSRRDWLRAHARKRGLSQESAGSGFDVTTDEYFADVWAVHKDVDDQLRANQDQPINLDRDATQWVTEQLMLRRDIVWASSYFATGVWATDMTGVGAGPTGDQFLKWTDAAATPITDFKDGIRRIQRTTAKKPNRLVLAPAVWDAISENSGVIDRVKHTQTGVLTLDLFGQLIGLAPGQVMVADGVVDTALENVDEAQDEGLVDFILTDGALLVYAAQSPSLMQPSGGYTFNWTGLIGGGSNGQRISSFRLERQKSDRVEGEMAFDTKIVAPEVGIFFDQAL